MSLKVGTGACMCLHCISVSISDGLLVFMVVEAGTTTDQGVFLKPVRFSDYA